MAIHFLSCAAAAAFACGLGCATASSANAQAATTGTVRVVHGLPGRDLARAADPQLPVDVSVSGTCILKGFAFGSISAPVTLPVGSYTVQVSLANYLTPCGNPAVLTQTVPLAGGEDAAVVAAVSPKGPALDALALDLSPIKTASGRIIVAHTAFTTAVSVSLDGKVAIKTLNPGKERAVSLPAATYQLTVANTKAALIGPIPLAIQDAGVTLVFAVGDPVKRTFNIVTETIPGVVQ